MTDTPDTEIELCNEAISLLGESPISAFDEGSDVAATCERNFKSLLTSVLSMHSWNFANKRIDLNIDLDAPARGSWLYGHSIPSNMKSGPEAVYAKGSDRPITSFENAGSHIYCNERDIEIDCVILPELHALPALFRDFFVNALAARMARALTGNAENGEECRHAAWGAKNLDGNGGLFLRAKRQDATTQRQRSFFENGDPLTATRR